LELVGGLKAGFRAYLNISLPEVEITNSDGNEDIFIEYKENQEKVPLSRKYNVSNRWSLPSNIKLESEFYIKIGKETLPGYEIAYRVISADDSCMKITTSLLPKRDSYGDIFTGNNQVYAEGSNVYGINWKMQQGFIPDFLPVIENDPIIPIFQDYTNEGGNLLLTYLTVKTESNAAEFYEVYERIYGNAYFQDDGENSNNFSRIKRVSLNLFDFLGYLDYEYQSSRIVVNPPQLIFIPTKKGRKTLLIGGRDPAFINRLMETGNKFGLGIEICQQQANSSHFLIPDTITVSASRPAKEGYGEMQLKALCSEMQIAFNTKEITQFGLQEFSVDITQYEQYVLSHNEVPPEDYNWARKIFNPLTLRFEKVDSNTFDMDYTLVEYKLREWEYHHKLWVKGRCYKVNKNWTRYIIIKRAKRQVVIYDSQKQVVAIPASMPLPRLFAESIALLSGRPSHTKSLSLDNHHHLFVLFENIPSVFIQNCFMKLGQKVIMQSI
jgi:hypothetical protein